MALPDARGASLAAGLFFLGTSAIALVASSSYRVGTTASMGPGFMPTLVGAGLACVGVALVARSLIGFRVAAQWGPWRPLVCICAALLAAAWLLPQTGLIPALVVLMALSELALPERGPWGRWLVFAAACIATACTVFVGVLGLNVPLFAWRPA